MQRPLKNTENKLIHYKTKRDNYKKKKEVQTGFLFSSTKIIIMSRNTRDSKQRCGGVVTRISAKRLAE